MWAKIDVIPSSVDIIFLPSKLAVDFIHSSTIIFGGILVKSIIQYSHDLDLDETSFEKPGTIKISKSLRDKLLIPEELTYQVKILESNIVIGPVIGFLLGTNTYYYNPNQMKKYSDRFSIYGKLGGLFYAFSPNYINWKNKTAYGLFYNALTTSWEYGCFPLPDVIYRRNFHSNPNIIKKLVEFTGGKVFNSYRFTKYELYDFVRKDINLKKYLPPTELSLSFEQVKRFIDCYSKVILKPIDLSRGRGICIIENLNDLYKITDYRYKIPKVSEYNIHSLKNFFIDNENLFNKYLIQKYLDMAQVGNSLFDVRVVMQKNENMDWKCTGIECRVSNSGHLTNISRGGYALCLAEALGKAFDTDQELLKTQVDQLCHEFCLYMDTWGKHFAEFGIDIAIDINKNLWIIEANVFPSFKGFKKMDRDTYISIRSTPLLYALSLTKFRRSDIKGVSK